MAASCAAFGGGSCYGNAGGSERVPGQALVDFLGAEFADEGLHQGIVLQRVRGTAPDDRPPAG